MKRQTEGHVLRTRPMPDRLSGLLSIANRLPTKADSSHDQVLSAPTWVSNQEFEDLPVRRSMLLRAIERLPPDLQAFCWRNPHVYLTEEGEIPVY